MYKRQAPWSTIETDHDVVRWGEFRHLVRYLGVYATWYELFRAADSGELREDAGIHGLRQLGDDGVQITDDMRIAEKEWARATEMLRTAGRTWAPFLRLADPHLASAFRGSVDKNGGGYVDLREFCEWMEEAEK